MTLINPHYLWEKKMQYLHDNLKLRVVYGWQNETPTL